MSRKLTTAEFIHRAKALHWDKYDYSNSEYVSNKVKVSVKCSKHGDFLTSPSDHMAGKGCRLCAYEYKGEKRKLTQAQYLQKLKQVHGDQYAYSKVSYVGADQKIIVTCCQHGDFEIVASAHANGVGCAKCFFERSAKQRMADHDAQKFFDAKSVFVPAPMAYQKVCEAYAAARSARFEHGQYGA